MVALQEPESRALAVADAARALGVHPQTVRRLVASGDLRAFRIGAPPHGHLRIPAAEIRRYLVAAAERAVERRAA